VQCTRFFTGPDNRTHFEDLDIRVDDRGRSAFFDTTTTMVRESDGTQHFLELHPAPRRQLIFCLAGIVEIESGDGTKRRFGPGDIYMADDLTGEGHSHREIEGPLVHVWVGLPDDFDVKPWGSKAG
jgi:hypothetical protein